jgi:uridine phosphorylase
MSTKKTILQPHILCKKGDVAKNVILPGDPGRVLRIAELLDSSKEISFNREYRVITGKYKGVPITICSTGIGGPSTAIAMEELIALGAKNFIRVGSCGANQKKINVGDLIISDSVVREDHTCLDYVPIQYPAIADPDTFQLMKKAAEKLKFKYYAGPTVTVDALYSPIIKEIKDFWKSKNTLAQDMEASTVVTLARLKGVRAGVVLLVVDHEAEKNIKEKIADYSIQARAGKGRLVKMEERAALLALETFKLMK